MMSKLRHNVDGLPSDAVGDGQPDPALHPAKRKHHYINNTEYLVALVRI